MKKMVRISTLEVVLWKSSNRFTVGFDPVEFEADLRKRLTDGGIDLTKTVSVYRDVATDDVVYTQEVEQ